MDTYLKELESALRAIEEHFAEDLRAIRTNRPSVELLEGVSVSYYDQMLPLEQLASISIQPPRNIIVTAWDKGAVGAIEKAINAANLGVSAATDGTTVRVSLPALTDERRKELTKLTGKIAEASRIQIRAKRDDIIKKVKAAEGEKELGEDQAFKLKEQVQKAVDEANKKVEAAVERKTKELND